MITSTESMLWDFIIYNNIATEEELQLVSSINGYTEESMMDVIFARTGLRSIEQCYDEQYWCTNELLERFNLLSDDDSDDDED